MFFALELDRANIQQANSNNLLGSLGITTADYSAQTSLFIPGSELDPHRPRQHRLSPVLPRRRAALAADQQMGRPRSVSRLFLLQLALIASQLDSCADLHLVHRLSLAVLAVRSFQLPCLPRSARYLPGRLHPGHHSLLLLCVKCDVCRAPSDRVHADFFTSAELPIRLSFFWTTMYLAGT
jgi:hypothetical protein